MDFRASSSPYRFAGLKGPWKFTGSRKTPVLTGSPSTLQDHLRNLFSTPGRPNGFPLQGFGPVLLHDAASRAGIGRFSVSRPRNPPEMTRSIRLETRTKSNSEARPVTATTLPALASSREQASFTRAAARTSSSPVRRYSLWRRTALSRLGVPPDLTSKFARLGAPLTRQVATWDTRQKRLRSSPRAIGKRPSEVNRLSIEFLLPS